MTEEPKPFKIQLGVWTLRVTGVIEPTEGYPGSGGHHEALGAVDWSAIEHIVEERLPAGLGFRVKIERDQHYSFVKNVVEARGNSYDLVCALCGCGMSDDEFDDPEMHEYGCPNIGRDRAAEQLAFLKKRLGPEVVARLLSEDIA